MLLWLDGIQSFTVTKALNSFQDRANVVLWKKAVFVLWANPGYTRRRAVRAHTWPSKACESLFVLLWFNIVLIKWNWIHLCSFDYTCTVHIHDAISYGLLCCNYVWNGILFLQYGVCIVYRPSIMCSFFWILCVHRLAECSAWPSVPCVMNEAQAKSPNLYFDWLHDQKASYIFSN